MGTKRYTTPEQRRILESVRIGHKRGRTYEEAEALIDIQISAKHLPPDIRLRATEKQKSLLRKLGVPFSEDITKQAGIDLITQKLDGLKMERPSTERQIEHIAEMGGIADRRMSLYEASKFIEYLREHRACCRKCGANFDRRDSRCYCGAFLPRIDPIRAPSYIFTAPNSAPKGILARIKYCLVSLGICGHGGELGDSTERKPSGLSR